MGSRPSHAVFQMVKPMTEIELNERITALLTERPIQGRAVPSHRYSGREMKVRKDDRLLKIINYGGYAPHIGYVDWGFSKARRKILCKRFSTKSRMALGSWADSGMNPLITESHGGQNGMRAGPA